MKNLILAALAAFTLVACNTDSEPKNTELKTRIDSVSYALGIDIGNSFAGAGLDSLNVDALAAAVRDVIDSNDMRITPEQADAIVQSFVMDFQAAKLQANLKAGEEFMAENRQRKDVKETESGLQYTILQEGTGAQPDMQDTVVFHFKESLADGKTLRDTKEGGRAALRADLQNPMLFEGWREAFTMMKEGAIWKIWLPAKLAYGEEGSQNVEGNQVVVYELELVEVVDIK